MEFHRSALKHGIAAEDALCAAKHYACVADLDEENPARDFRLGFDSAVDRLNLSCLLRQWQRAADSCDEGARSVRGLDCVTGASGCRAG